MIAILTLGLIIRACVRNLDLRVLLFYKRELWASKWAGAKGIDFLIAFLWIFNSQKTGSARPEVVKTRIKNHSQIFFRSSVNFVNRFSTSNSTFRTGSARLEVVKTFFFSIQFSVYYKTRFSSAILIRNLIIINFCISSDYQI